MLIQPEPDREGEATTEGITVELVSEGLWVQRGTSPRRVELRLRPHPRSKPAP